MNHKQLIKIEWTATKAMNAIKSFTAREEAMDLNHAANILAIVRSAGQYLCDPDTTDAVRADVIDTMVNNLFKG